MGWGLRISRGDLELLAIQTATVFVLTDSRRILHENDPPQSRGPRFYLGGCESGNVARIRHDVSGETANAIEALIADEPPFVDQHRTPVHLDEYISLLTGEAPLVRESSQGPVYCLPNQLEYQHDFTLVSSNSPQGDRLLAELADRGMPPALVEAGFDTTEEFWPPWCVALHDAEIASIAFAARIGPAGAEAGVFTFPAFRRRGFAAAVTAGWASHPSLAGRALFYSTDRANVASQGVAGRLGLRCIGASLRLT